MNNQRSKSEDYWKKKLTPEEYRILREKGTEPAFAGKLLGNHEDGMYHCAACGAPLFSSDTKYESGSGWPSFWNAVDEESVELAKDSSYGMTRTEVMCAKCGSHLGHFFNDGPTALPDGRQATGARYCVNSASLKFSPRKK
jgi:peptide-methionine (R)-S-oxide reductase